MRPSDVLALHADLTDRYEHPSRALQVSNDWSAAPYMPRMLAEARTYEVTVPTVDLADTLKGRQDSPVLGELHAEELPYHTGFMWLDRPVGFTIQQDHVDIGGGVAVQVPGEESLVSVQALSWMQTKAYQTVGGASWPREFERDLPPGHMLTEQQRTAIRPAGGRKTWRTACWLMYWCDPPDELHRQVYGPLFPCGWIVFPGRRAHERGSDLGCVQLTRAIWALMDMDVTDVTEAALTRADTRRHSKPKPVRVVDLHRSRKLPSGHHRDVDWSCQWIVRGHKRRLHSGRTTWVRPYIKGPDDKPFRASDALYRV